MKTPFAKIVLGFCTVVALAVAVVAVLNLTQPKTPARPLPNPNGYDDLVRAGEQLSGDYDKASGLPLEDLRALVKTNAPALELARLGLSRECRAPLDTDPRAGTHLPRLGTMKEVARAFVAEGRLAELENRPADAVRSYLGAIQTGHAIEQGGVMIHGLVSVALQAIGLVRLETLLPGSDAATCREILNGLQAAEARSVPHPQILEEEKAWVRRVYGWKGPLMRLVMKKSIKSAEKGFVGKYQGTAIRTRMFLLKTAARAYELEKGRAPGAAADLVPEYLKALPKDPYTGADLSLP